MKIDYRSARIAAGPAAVLLGLAGAIGFGASGAAKSVDVPDSFSSSGGRGSLIGVILDAREDPIPGARVLVRGEDGEALFETTSSISSEEPLDLGAFKVDGLPPGRYQVVAVLDATHSMSRPLSVPIVAWLDTRVRLHIDTGL
jgi:hypothetical protein